MAGTINKKLIQKEIFKNRAVKKMVSDIVQKEVEKEKVRSQLKKNAVIVQNSYSWDRLATETLAGYEEVLTKL